ncbi:hypothetical protein MMC11_001377 [Xylographa trunciseda]|nr:hypothetical protein [Xylographa trunciseda]
MQSRRPPDTSTRPRPRPRPRPLPATSCTSDTTAESDVLLSSQQTACSSVSHPSPSPPGLSWGAPSCATSTTTDSTSKSTRPAGRRRVSSSSTANIRPALHISQEESYFAIPRTTFGAEARSPANKRPPASRSSHGIETSSGPPPALSTQWTVATCNDWRLPLPGDSLFTFPTLTAKALMGLDAQNIIATERLVEESPQLLAKAKASTDIKGGQEADDREGGMVAAITPPFDHHTSTTGRDRQWASTGKDMDTSNNNVGAQGTKEEQQSQSSQEDYFLNLAHTDVARSEITEAADRTERRRSRIAQATHRLSISNGTGQGSDLRTQTNGGDHEIVHPSFSVTERRSSLQKADQSSYSRTPISPGRPNHTHRSYAASAHPLDQRHRSHLSGNTSKPTYAPSSAQSQREASPELPSIYGRRPSAPESNHRFPTREYRQSNLSLAPNGHYHSSPLTGRSGLYEEDSPSTPRAEGTESTVSTTAPSTIFDELDDLKSRLKKLELTAKMPTSSSAAIATTTGERPRTATTTVTTMSPSPNHGRDMSASPSTSVPGVQVDAGTHPLLNSALAKTKPIISRHVYRVLEATAIDALTLAKMASNGASGVPGSGIDRQLKRKADSMCRSMTELCIALADDRTEVDVPKTIIRPGSRDANSSRFQRGTSTEAPSYEKGSSQEPEESSTSRVISRLEARRTSMLGLQGFTQGVSRGKEQQVELGTPNQNSSGLIRTSTVLQRARRVLEDDNERPARSVSRANTESSQYIPPRRQSSSNRDHLQQHAPSIQDMRTPTVQSSLPVRRTYLSSSSQQPSTPTAQYTSRQYLDRTTPNSADNARLAEARQRRYASFGHFNSAIRQVAENTGRRVRHESIEPSGSDGQGVD